MLLEILRETVSYVRISKLGHPHHYTRSKTVLLMRCDNCDVIFKRDQSNLAPNRRNNNYFHVCSKCDAKRFAQRKGVEKRFIWDRLASSNDDISKL
jgi:hypothetical protein